MKELFFTLIGKVIGKIVLALLPILLVLFPNNPAVICIDQQINNHSGIAAPKILSAFVEKDVDALENLMCNNIKQNTEDLSSEINKMFSFIEGDVVEATYETGTYSFQGNRENGKQIVQSGIQIDIITTENTYIVGVTWEAINTFQKEETGIRRIFLLKKTTDNIPKTLCEISATDGVGEWHD